MDWRNEAAGELPRPRPREPRTLRQDLLDEVQDHLLLAAEDEHAVNIDASEDEIRKSVIERFGNPAALVRRLWWDAMKEVVMRDRIIAAAAVVTAVAFVLFVAGVWTHMSRRQDVLLTAISELRQESVRPEYSTTLVLHRGSLDGPPAEGIEVSLSHKPAEGTPLVVNDKTGPDGSVTFKFQNEGGYGLTLYDPVSLMTLEKRLTIFAGHGEGEQRIAAPDIGSAELRLQSPLPPQISDDEALLLVSLDCEVNVDGSVWRFQESVLVGKQDLARSPMRTSVSARASHGLGDAARQGVSYTRLEGPRFEALKVPGHPIHIRAVSPAVALFEGSRRGQYAIPAHDRFSSARASSGYASGLCTVEPGEGPQLIPIDEAALDALLGAVRYQRVVRMELFTNWANQFMSHSDAFLLNAQMLETELVRKTEDGLQIRPFDSREWVPAPDDLAQGLAMFAEDGAVLLVTAPETIEASQDAAPLELVFLYLQRDGQPLREPPEPKILVLDEKKLVESPETTLSWGPEKETVLLRVALPPEYRRVEAGTPFLIQIPGIEEAQVDRLFPLPPLLAEFEAIDLTLAQQALELCSK